MSLKAQLAGRTLGRDAGMLVLHGPPDHCQVCAHLLAQVRRELCLLTHDLDKAIFDQMPFLIGLRSLALRSPRSHIRILIQDPSQPVREGHRVLELTRRFTSTMEIHVPHEDFIDHPESFLLADRCGYVHRRLSSRYEGTADYHAPLLVRRLYSLFEDMWQTSHVDPQLRRLYL
jgi:hypothetical protein